MINRDNLVLTQDFLKGGGEMSELILTHDWSSSAIGTMDNWPRSLRITLANILHSAFPMFLFWGDDLICFYNDAYRPSLGFEGKHSAIGKKAHEVWPEIWDAIDPLIQQVLRTGRPAWFEDRLIPINRNNHVEDVYWTFSYSPAFGDTAEICGVMVTCMETTQTVLDRRNIGRLIAERTEELERAHEALVDANLFFQRIIDLSKEPLQVLQPVFENGEIIDFTFRFTNSAYAAYAGTTPDALQGKKVSVFFPGYFQTSSFINVVKIFNSQKSDTWEIHYSEDGLDLHNRMTAVKMDGYVVVHFTDFTELKNLQIQLLRKITELEQSNTNLEEVAHAASHDLKEPIRKVGVFVSKLKDQLTDRIVEKEVMTFEKIEDAVTRMSSLIDDLLAYSSMGQTPPEKEMHDLNVDLPKVLDDLEVYITDKQAQIVVSQLPVVRGYKRQLQQMFQNLIGNALKYCHADVKPVINIYSTQETINGEFFHSISIEDNGIGFESRYKDKIFQLFTRLNSKDEYSGTGIGLSIVKKVVENHDGKIYVESSPGKGSVFRVLLPV